MKAAFRYVILILFYITSIGVHALNDARIDSLKHVLDGAKEDTNKVNVLLELVTVYEINDQKIALQYAITANELSVQLDFSSGIIRSLNAKGYQHYLSSKFSEAMEQHHLALDEALIREDEAAIATCYNYMGMVFNKLGSIQKAEEYFVESARYFGKSNHPLKAGMAYFNLGVTLSKQGDYNASINYLNKALKQYQAINDTSRMGKAYLQLGYANAWMGEVGAAMEFYIKALEVFEAKNNSLGMADVYNAIGWMNNYNNDHKKALEYYQKAIDLCESLGEKKEAVTTYNNVGVVYKKQKNYTKAVEYYQKALSYSEELNDFPGIINGCNNFAILFAEQESYGTSETYFNRALEVARQTDDQNMMAVTHSNLGFLYFIQSKYDEAIEQYKNCLTIAQKIGVPNSIVGAHEGLIEIYKEKGDYENALAHSDLLFQVKDSLLTAEKNRQMLEVQIRYETEKKDQENQLLTQQNKIQAFELKENRNWMIGLAIVLILVLTLGFLAFRQHRLKNAQQKVLLEQKLLRTQMNPHFIFNSLSSIQNYIIQSNTEEASNYLTDFGRLMRMNLEESSKEYIILDRELNILQLYLKLQHLRFQDMFDYHIEVDERLNRELIAIPPMFAQPFIENALEHGIRYKESKGHIWVKFTQKNDLLELTVEDDGVGIDGAGTKKHRQSGEYQSMATAITKERLSVLQKLTRHHLSMNITNRMEAGKSVGTKVTFLLPYQYL